MLDSPIRVTYSAAMTFNNILLYCRPGFEKECAAEITDIASAAEITGYVRTREDSGYVLYCSYSPIDETEFRQQINFSSLVFARQCLLAMDILKDLPVDDRLSPVMTQVEQLQRPFQQTWLETPDTNEAKQLSNFCKKFEKPLLNALKQQQLIQQDSLYRLHLFFLSSSAVYIAISHVDNSASLPMGIPRLRMPKSAPSRSTLKLDEAFNFMLNEKERKDYLQNGMTAVDLGACPGGWTWQLVNRGIRVTAIDNGNMNQQLMDTGLVDHLRKDGFSYEPEKTVDWLVCDMVEKPMRITQLIIKWLNHGLCRNAVFNLKLPMKKRYQMVSDCRQQLTEALEQSGYYYQLRMKQLYHDREEITVVILQ